MSRITLRGPVTEEFLAFSAEKTADDGNGVIALLEDIPAGNQTSSPLVVVRTALAAVSSNVFLGNAEDDRANSGPHAGTRAHGTGFVRGVEHEVGQVPAVAAGDVLERFQLYVLDAGSRSFYSITGAGNHHLATAREACDHRSYGIVAAVAGPFGLCNGQLHEFLSRFVGRRNHVDRLYSFVASVSRIAAHVRLTR